MKKLRRWLRHIRYGLEGALLLMTLLLFRVMPLDLASALGGWLARIAGPFTRAHRTAERNMQRALPGMSAIERSRTLSLMWDNIGRTIGEYPHISRPIMARRITVEGREHVEAAKASNEGSLFVSGHFANWEIGPLTGALCDMPLTLIYRRPNNPFADLIIRHIRRRYSSSLYGKGREGAQQAIRMLKQKRAVAMLVDQKMNDGSPVSFFGHPAMTATAVAQLAIRFQVPMIPARVVRTDGAHFHATILPPMRFAPDASPPAIMEELHRLFERWIREHPAQWFWIHNRWNWNK